MEIAIAGVGDAALTAVRSRVAIGRRLASTPGLLRLAAVMLAISATVVLAVGAHAAGTRRDAAAKVTAIERRLVSAVGLSASLSDAHAIAASSFLAGGPEPAVSRRRYARQLRRASSGVAVLASEVGASAGSGSAVRRITQKLPVYAGYIDDARANHRQNFPVGSAYLRRASQTMREEILPAAGDLYRIEAQRLTTSYRAGVSLSSVLGVVLAGCAMLALLIATQVYMARVTRRIVNPRLALATAALLGLLIWILAAFAQQQTALAQAQREGSDPVELLTVTRILASRAQANESIALAARGGGDGEPRLADVDRGFRAVTRPIGVARRGSARGSGGLLQRAAVIAGDSPAGVDAIYAAYRRYLEAHRRVAAQEQRGDFSRAVKLAIGGGASPSASTAAAAAAFNRALDNEVGRAHRRFDGAASRAQAALGGLAAGIPLLTALSALLALLGVRQRLQEYR
ncbi:MAG: hypothetical protein QOD69_3081 [Solirubrobacteraceae bacterium]|nr:hypothetical protein [Solirubrobacteraceae bacterium]